MTNDMMQMQREAARRVNRMQEHSRRVFEEHRGDFGSPVRGSQAAGFTQPVIRSSGLYAQPAPAATAPNENKPAKAPATSSLDGEQWLLLGLALLLFRCGCNPALAIALVYLAL